MYVCVCVHVCTCVGACVCAHAVIHSITVNIVTELKSVVIQLYMRIESHKLSEKQSQRLHHNIIITITQIHVNVCTV